MNDSLTDDVVPADTATSEKLSKAIHEGQRTVPRAPAALVCKPNKIESWRIFKIMSEFVEGFDVIRRYTVAASFFGSTRTTPDDPIFEQASELASRLSKRGFAIITGGSSGIMQASNKGAYEAGGASVGLNIRLPDAQGYNKYLTDKFSFDHFFVRKVMLTYASEVYIYFPGGFGTLDEFFEIITLVQTKKIRNIPVVLYGTSYWKPILEVFENTLYKGGYIDKGDMTLYTLVDSVDEAYDYIIKNVKC